MIRLLLVLMIALPANIFAQLAMVSSTPADNATNVPLTSTFTMTFNAVLDTNALRESLGQWSATNIDSAGDITFGADGKSFSAPIQLNANTPYFFGMFGLKGKDGSILTTPFGIHFTTAASFPTPSVSGTISSGITGVSPENSFVGLSSIDVRISSSDGPKFVALGSVSVGGAFSIPYVPNGTYWPLAAKDANGDGEIDPTNGSDVVAFGDSIVVNNASVTSVTLTFAKFSPLTYADALPIADSLAKSLPADRLLKSVQGYGVDTLGRSDSWTFIYVINGGGDGREIRVNSFSSQTEQITDTYYLSGLNAMHTLTNPELAADSPVIVANAEAQGGRAFRTKTVPDSLAFEIETDLGDLSMRDYSELSPNPSLNYWGVRYSFGVQGANTWYEYQVKKFLCDFTTGTVLGATGVKEAEATPASDFSLDQNYPNPFNPTTQIAFQIKNPGFVRLAVYDILGRQVAELVNEQMQSGHYTSTWDASSVSTGVYLYRLSVTDAAGRSLFASTRRMLLVK